MQIIIPSKCKTVILIYLLILTACQATSPGPLSRHSAVIYKDNMIVFGGARMIDGKNQMISDMWSYNLISRNWKKNQQSLHPSARGGHSAVLYHNKMYVFGGYNPEKKFLSDIWIFDPEKNKWEILKTENNPPGRYMQSMCANRSGIYIYGGFREPPDTLLNDLWQLDMNNHRWVRLSNDVARQRPSNACDDDQWYFFSSDGQASDSDISIYDFKSESWRHKIDLYSGIHFAGAGILREGYFIVLGGADGDGFDYHLTGSNFYWPGTKFLFPEIRRRLHTALNYEGYIVVFGGQVEKQKNLDDVLMLPVIPYALTQEKTEENVRILVKNYWELKSARKVKDFYYMLSMAERSGFLRILQTDENSAVEALQKYADFIELRTPEENKKPLLNQIIKIYPEDGNLIVEYSAAGAVKPSGVPEIESKYIMKYENGGWKFDGQIKPDGRRLPLMALHGSELADVRKLLPQ